VTGHRAGIVPRASVEGWLTAARLTFRIVNLNVQPFEHADDSHACFGLQGLDEAGGEELDGAYRDHLGRTGNTK